MRPRVLKIMLAIAIALPMVLLVVPADPAQALGPGDLVMLVNNIRTGVHVAPLATDPTLTAVAQAWANNMAATGVLAHNPNLATQAPSGWTKIGENIGDGFSVTAVFNALVNSIPHYDNMVDPSFNRTGVGVATSASGQVWITEDFGTYPPPPLPVIVFPTTGTVIFPSAQPFSWQQVTGASIYCLTVGTTEGGLDLFYSGTLSATQLSVTVPALPAGQILWVRVYSFIGGTWTWADATFSVA